MKRALLFAVAVILCATSAFAKGEVEILLPYDKAIVTTPHLMVFYKSKDPARLAPLIVSAKDEMSFIARKQIEEGGMNCNHVLLPLDEGSNTFHWINSETEKRLVSLTVYYVPAHSNKIITDPDAKNFYFHTQKNEEPCKQCHELNENYTPDEKATTVGETCVTCHYKFKEGEKAHKPVAEMTCLKCHQSDTSNSRMGVNTKTDELCRECHLDFIKKEVDAKEFIHGPVVVGRCLSCHYAHGDSKKLLLKEKTSDLCNQCHEVATEGKGWESLHLDEECDSCHSPHAGDNPYFVKGNESDPCLECHDEIQDGEHAAMMEHPFTGHKDPRRKGRNYSCASCHTPHGGEDIIFKGIFDDLEKERQFCSDCHD